MSLWGGGGGGVKERGPGREGLWGRDVGDQRERETETHTQRERERERERERSRLTFLFQRCVQFDEWDQFFFACC